MKSTPSPQEQYEKFKVLFAEMNDERLIDCFNNQVGNTGWTSSRASYLAAMHHEFDNRNWDYREIGSKTSLSYRQHIYLTDKRVSVYSGN